MVDVLLKREVWPSAGDSGGSLSEFADAAAGMPLLFQPGSCWHYGINTDICGALVRAQPRLAQPPCAHAVWCMGGCLPI